MYWPRALWPDWHSRRRRPTRGPSAASLRPASTALQAAVAVHGDQAKLAELAESVLDLEVDPRRPTAARTSLDASVQFGRRQRSGAVRRKW